MLDSGQLVYKVWVVALPSKKQFNGSSITKNKRQTQPELLNTKKWPLKISIFEFLQKDLAIVSFMKMIRKFVNCQIFILFYYFYHNRHHLRSFWCCWRNSNNLLNCIYNRICNRISNLWRTIIFFPVLNVAVINSRILVMSARKPPTEYKWKQYF